MSIPPGFERCELCGEFNGTTRARYLKPDRSRSDPDRKVSVTCLCYGVPCLKCGKGQVHRPGTSSYSEKENRIGHWSSLFANLLIVCSECRKGDESYQSYKQVLEMPIERPAPLPPPPRDPGEILDIVIGECADGEGPFYRVIRYGRRHEPVIFPCGDELSELLENDPDFHDYETFLYVLTEEGEVVFSHEWDSGGPGAGAGIECVYELAGRFYYPCCDCPELFGSYDTVDEAVEGDLLMVNSATYNVESSYHGDEELAARAEFNGAPGDGEDERLGHEIWFNCIPYVWSKPGVFVKKDDEDDGLC
jgi:hypothetical protein